MGKLKNMGMAIERQGINWGLFPDSEQMTPEHLQKAQDDMARAAVGNIIHDPAYMDEKTGTLPQYLGAAGDEYGYIRPEESLRIHAAAREAALQQRQQSSSREL